MMYYCHKCGYLGKGRGKKWVTIGVRRCCGAMMQSLDKKTAEKVREQDERLKENT